MHLSTTGKRLFFRIERYLTLSLPAYLFALNGYAQAVGSDRNAQHSLEVRGGYTGGRFTHYTDDFTSSFNLFGGGRSQTGQLVAHRFNGLLLGADFVRESIQTGSPQKITLLAGLDVLAAADRLTFADDRRMTLSLTAAHPHAAVEISDANWLVRAEAGLLLGRVGYSASSSTLDILSTRTVVDTVQVVPSFRLRTG